MIAATTVLAAEFETSTKLPPTRVPGFRPAAELLPEITYDPEFPKPDRFLGFPAGERAANSDQITHALKAWTAARTNRTRLIEYARTHENRPLHYMVISSEANIARLEETRAAWKGLPTREKSRRSRLGS